MRGKLLWVMCLFIGLAATAAQAITIAPTTITVDENGNGSVGSTAIKGAVIPDPTSTTGSKVLAYPLPFPVTPGDVVLTEPGTTEPSNSDLIRFVILGPVGPVGPTSLLLFYSDLPAAGETADLADLGVPPASLMAKVFTETGLFGSPYSEGGPNGLVYTPGPTDPGAGGLDPATAGTLSGFSYTFISDAAGVPLPASAWAGLALIAGFGVWRVVRRRSNCGLRI